MTEIKRLFDFPQYQLANHPLEKSLVTKYKGKWEALSSQQFIDQANAVSRGLIKLGIKPNDKIAVITSSNRSEWSVLDIGILQTGAQNVPIYPTIGEEDYEYIINHSESTLCFVSDKEIYDKLQLVRQNTPLKAIYSFDEVPGCPNWQEILTLGEDTSTQDEVEQRKNAVSEDDLATLIYTSGTTGKPKGVMLTHENIVSDVLMSSDRVPFEFGTYVALSFLPVCHIFERMILYLYQYYSVSIHFAESIEKISDNLKEVRPHVISAVPRLLEKVYDKIIAKGSDLGGVKQKLFFWAVELGLKFEPYGANGWWYETQLNLARKLIFSKWKEGLGGRIELIVSGSAALQPRLSRVFAAADIPVMEGYGLTETSPVISVNDQRRGGFKIGTVGKVLSDVEVKIAEDGEILTKGPNLMKGYFKDEEKTRQEIDVDGWFHTGDIGELDSEGFLKITDRKKEMFKTSGGKYVAPQVIENRMKQSRFIGEIMVVGEGERMPGAFIQPDFDFVREWAKRKELQVGDTNADLIKNPDVIARIQEEVDFYNQKFGNWEKIKRFELTPDVWSIEGEHLTPTMKLKRRNIIKIYQELYDRIYRQQN